MRADKSDESAQGAFEISWKTVRTGMPLSNNVARE
jgi:hypothetical protein